MLSERYLNAIKSFEGYTAQATPDYAQLSNGYGTKALFAGETIDRAEAERRFRVEVAHAESLVEQFAPGLDEGTKAALTSLTYNAGPRWMQSGLGQSVKSGDLTATAQILTQYNKAGGRVLAGLATRRLEEATWIGTGLPRADVVTAQKASVGDKVVAATTNTVVSRPIQSAAVTAATGSAASGSAASGSAATVEVKSVIAERLVFLGLQSVLNAKDDAAGLRAKEADG